MEKVLEGNFLKYFFLACSILQSGKDRMMMDLVEKRMEKIERRRVWGLG